MPTSGGGLTFLGKARARQGKSGCFCVSAYAPSDFLCVFSHVWAIELSARVRVQTHTHTHAHTYNRRWQHTLKPKLSDLFLSQCRSESTFKAITCPQFAWLTALCTWIYRSASTRMAEQGACQAVGDLYDVYVMPPSMLTSVCQLSCHKYLPHFDIRPSPFSRVIFPCSRTANMHAHTYTLTLEAHMPHTHILVLGLLSAAVVAVCLDNARLYLAKIIYKFAACRFIAAC